MMKKLFPILLLILIAASAEAQQSGFSYQGKLTNGAKAANGSYDFEFRLYDAITGGSQVGDTVTVTNLGVTDGTFSAKVDFGDNLWNGLDRFIEIRVRNAGFGSYTLLSPRKKSPQFALCRTVCFRVTSRYRS